MFFGRGAGSKPTASAVVGDILEIAQSMDAPSRRLRFEKAPVFDAAPAQKRRLLVRFAGDASAVQTALPHCEIRAVGDEFALMTAEAPACELEDALNALSGTVRMGAPLYVLN